MIIRKVLSAITAAAMLATTLPITVAFADNGTENKPTEQAVSAVEQISEPIMEDAEIAETLPYQDTSLSFEERAADLVARMTLEEKVALCHAQSKFSSPGVPRLGLPENWMTDGPHGVRAEVIWDEWDQAGWTNDSCMAFPALTCLAATWNPEMALLYGKSIGEEA